MRATCPAHLILFGFIILRVHVMNIVIMQFSPASYYFIPLRPNYCPQYPVLKYLQPMFLSQYKRPSFTLIQNYRQNYSDVYFYVYVFR
jgi:hypothetical protein